MKKVFSVMFAASVVGCGSPTPVGSDGGTDAQLVCDANPTEVTTAQLQADLLNTSCKTGCHEPTGSAASTSMADAAATQKLVGAASVYAGSAGTLKVVEANNPANSTMWLKVLGGSPSYRGPKGESVGGVMPQGAPALDDAKKQMLKNWICSGAKP